MPFYDAPGVSYDAGFFYDGFQPPISKKGRMAEIQLNLSKMTIDDGLQLAVNLHTGMLANVATFATPNPTAVAFQTLVTNFTNDNNSYEAEKITLKTKQNARDASFALMQNGMRQWKAYAENTTSDSTKWQALGFSLKGQAVPVGPLGQVLTLVLTAGDNDGTLDAAWDPLKGAQSYEVQVSVDPVSGTSWAPKLTAGKSSATIGGLASGTRMWVRVRGIGANNTPGPWSDPAVKTVP
jgi:hypothetical protein